MAATSQKRSGTTDLTVGKPLFQILRFALPLVLGTLFQQLYSFAETVTVKSFLAGFANLIQMVRSPALTVMVVLAERSQQVLG